MQTIVFDMDGVLIDSEPIHYATDILLPKELTISVPDDYLDKFVGTTNPFMWFQILNDFKINKDLQEILDKQLALKIITLEEGNYQPISGITELLIRINKHNTTMAVASSSSIFFIEAVLTKLKIDKYFKLYVSGEEVKKSKPEPDIFLKTAEMIQINPKECIVIEDSKNGVIAAKRAGMKCIGYINPNSGNQDLLEANIVINDFNVLTHEIIQCM
jgi:HAD superfamily hydrolase (TIGR01509 family)